MIRFSKEEGFIKPIGISFREGQDVNIKLPSVAIGVFSRHLFDKMIENNKCYEVGYISIANSERNVYIMEYEGELITLFMAGVGGPVIASDMEELIKMGISKFIIFGNCGVLDNKIEDCSIIIPNLSYREDGTSQHYILDSETIEINPKYKDEFIKILNKYNYNYYIGPTWTTDAIYRETPEKIEYYKNKGVITVEMEASIIASVSKYRKVNYFTFYYAGDLLDAEQWNERSIHGHVNLSKKVEVSRLALEMAKTLIKK